MRDKTKVKGEKGLGWITVAGMRSPVLVCEDSEGKRVELPMEYASNGMYDIEEPKDLTVLFVQEND